MALYGRAQAGVSQSNVLQLQTDGPGKSISMRGFSSRASGSAASAPYEIGKTAVSNSIQQITKNDVQRDTLYDLHFLM